MEVSEATRFKRTFILYLTGITMAVNLENLSPKELQAIIAEAESKMKSAHSNLVEDVRKKIDALLNISGLTLAEVYPTRGGKKAPGTKSSVAPKYRDLVDPTKTWSGRGRQPLWFTQAIKKRGVTAESLLIGGTTPKAPAKTAKKATKKAVKKSAAKKTAKA
ncbi:DNA-binding protein H-NS [Rhodanobacter sp. ANJX3]|uniref:H-NS histone family protein n=1 Tax=Rhodanobacter sp. ANJX3 TaxID=2723083 RepID=UPI00181E385C|nr:H-NS histone family protein [Rhodanobacter sp. ANJX3]MBB5357348.1 DNA-binding protein H-NS [Rhodanobacter sp. ANJX3]